MQKKEVNLYCPECGNCICIFCGDCHVCDEEIACENRFVGEEGEEMLWEVTPIRSRTMLPDERDIQEFDEWEMANLGKVCSGATRGRLEAWTEGRRRGKEKIGRLEKIIIEYQRLLSAMVNGINLLSENVDDSCHSGPWSLVNPDRLSELYRLVEGGLKKYATDGSRRNTKKDGEGALPVHIV